MISATLKETASRECTVSLPMLGSQFRISDPAELFELATILGWVGCECGATNGATDCEHRKSESMFDEAMSFLNDCMDAEFELPLGSRILNAHFW